jgi:protein ImuB
MADCATLHPLLATDPPTASCSTSGGCAHLFGGEEKLRDDLLARVTGFGFSARAAIAASIGAASAAARFGAAARPQPIMSAICLAPLPLAALRLSSDTVAALARSA